MTTGARFKEKGLSPFPTKINRNVSLSLEEPRISCILTRAPVHCNPTTELLEKI